MFYFILAATPLEASGGTLNVFFLYFKYVYVVLKYIGKIKNILKNLDFLAISPGRMVVPSPKIFINLTGTYEKLPC